MSQPRSLPRRAGEGEAASDERFRLLVESVVDYAIFMLDPQGRITSWNAGAERLKGYSANEIIGQSFSAFYTPEDREREHPAEVLERAATDGRYAEEGWRVRKDGTLFWASITLTALRDHWGVLVGYAKVTRDLTERREAEERLRRAYEDLDRRVVERTAELTRLNEVLHEREQQLTDFVENAPLGLHWVGPDGTILWANRAELEMLGYAREEYVGHNIAEFHADRESIDDILRRLADRETLYEYEARLRCRDGSIRHVLINSSVLWDGDRFVHTRCFTRDVTEERKLKAELEAEQQLLREVFELAPSFMCTLRGPDYVFEIANANYQRLLGNRPLVGRPAREAVPEVASQGFFDLLDRVFQTGEPYTGREMPLQVASGPNGELREVFLNFVYQPLREPDGSISGIFVHGVDVTEQVLARRRVQALADLNQTLTENATAALFLMDTQGCCTFMNPAAEAVTGYTLDEIRNRPLHEAIHHTRPDGTPYPMDECPIDRALPERNKVRAHEDLFFRKDGTPFPVVVAAEPIFQDRRPVGTVVEVRDITQEKRSEALLTGQKHLLEMIARGEELRSVLLAAAQLVEEQSTGALCSILLLDTEGRLHEGAAPSLPEAYNSRIEGLPIGEGAGSCGTAAFRREPVVVSDIAKDPLWADYRSVALEHGLRACWSTPILGSGGGVLGTVAMYSREPRGPSEGDLELTGIVTRLAGIAIERARAEAALRLRARELAERDRQKDEFLAMLAHELRNPLAPIINASQVLRARSEGDPVLERQQQVIHTQARHMARLLDDLLDVSRITQGKIELRRQVVDLAATAEQAVETARPLIETRRHRLLMDLPREPLLVEADPTRLHQVIGNLLNNAAKYTNPGGEIRLTVSSEGDMAVIRVADNGSGISPEFLPRIFDLFTQGDRSLGRAESGLGIGLTMVKRLVELHGGTITASSEGPGRGSEFEVRWPAARRRPRIEAPPQAAAPDPEPGRRVLIVDDNRDAAETLADLVRLWGHEVHAVFDGQSAIDAFSEAEPEVVLLDISMPGMDGFEVARRLRELPGGEALLLIALTGYGQEQDRRRAHLAGFDQHLTKPVEPEVLRALLAAPRMAASR